VVLGAYVALIYASLPVGPRIGLAILRTRPGAWVLGPGVTAIIVAGAVGLLLRLRYRRAPWWAYGAVGVAALGYGLGFSWLQAQHLERTHLPEYGVVAWLAWRAVAPLVSGTFAGYAAAVAIGSAIGYGDELLQAVIPGRVYDLRDVAMNVLGTVLGMVVIAALRTGGVSGESSARRSPRAAGSSPQ
jgi:hypothetical protein